MLNNAKNFKKEYEKRIAEIGDTIVSTIITLEKENWWEDQCNEYGEIDLILCSFGTYEDTDGIDFKHVYFYLDDIGVDEIAEDKTVTEALEEIFDINYGTNTFSLVLRYE